jgi:hypothetical protein
MSATFVIYTMGPDDHDGIDVAAFAAEAPANCAPQIRPFASLVALFALATFLNTDIFLNDVLAKLGNTLRPSGVPNAYGTVVQCLILVVLFAMAVTLLQHGVI